MKKTKILVVEDERIVAEDIKRSLEALGYKVCSIVSTGEDAVKQAGRYKPDLVLMDIVLKGKMNGIKAANQITSLYHIPVVYLTAYADENTLQRAKITQPYGYIIKPFTDRELYSNIEIALYKSRMERKIEHLNAVLRALCNVSQLTTTEKDRDRLLKGACENLIGTRGYHSAWIVLWDENGKPVTAAEAGLGEDFFKMIELLKDGKLPICGEKALFQSDIVVTSNPFSICTNCPLAGKYKGRSAMTVRLEHGEKIYGMLTVSIPRELARDKEEQKLFKELAGELAFALYSIEIEEERKQAEKKLRESEEKYASLINDAIDSLPSGIFILDRDFKIVWVNRTIEDFFGIDKNSLIGCDKRKAIKERIKYIFEDPEQFEQIVFRTYENNTYVEKFECHVLPSGKRKERFLLHWSIPIRTGALVGGRIEHYYDITEQKRAKEKLQQSYNKLKKTFWQIVRTLSTITKVKDPYTAGHQQRVTKLACAIATEMGLPDERIEGIYIAGLLHDIGKIAIPAEILNKPTELTEAESNLIKTHPQVGYDILKNIEFSEPIAQIVLQHHEMMDGSGYPQGLKGKEILLEARILAVADVVEAISSHRPYRPALGLDKALEEIAQNKGTLYDPKVVDTCLKLFTEKGFRFD